MAPIKFAPAVCYESIYGEFISKYVRNGASLIVIITNDGWWGNTPGYKQHENYARLRAYRNPALGGPKRQYRYFLLHRSLRGGIRSSGLGSGHRNKNEYSCNDRK